MQRFQLNIISFLLLVSRFSTFQGWKSAIQMRLWKDGFVGYIFDYIHCAQSIPFFSVSSQGKEVQFNLFNSLIVKSGFFSTFNLWRMWINPNLSFDISPVWTYRGRNVHLFSMSYVTVVYEGPQWTKLLDDDFLAFKLQISSLRLWFRFCQRVSTIAFKFWDHQWKKLIWMRIFWVSNSEFRLQDFDFNFISMFWQCVIKLYVNSD